jgi:predicted PurR-regulated permease PerM
MPGYELRPTKIEISAKSIIKIIVIILAFWFAYLIRDILLILFVVMILVSAIYPLADWFQSKKIPRLVGVLIIYLIFLALISFIVFLLIPPLIEEVRQLTNDFPHYWTKISTEVTNLGTYSSEYGLQIQDNLKNLNNALGRAASGVFSILTDIFGGIFSLVVVLVLTFYMVAEKEALKNILRSAVPIQYQPRLVRLVVKTQKKLGQWVRGQLILCFIIGTMVYIGLSILGIKYALVLGLLAALTEFIPYLGPIIGSIPAIFIAFSQSPILALFVVILFILVNQLENHIIVPKLMQKMTGINPVVSIIALLVGAEIAGIIGVVLAIPVAICVSVILEDLIENSKKQI